MSGHVVKIVIENTKPPIWRRIVLPEKIQFDDLHEIIQMTFGWKDVYDHEFSFPYGNLRILPSPDTNSYRTVAEDYVIYEDYLEEVNWIRYKYYSRDLIKHKIFYEKLDPTYKHRYATVLKVKGDDHRDLEYISFDDEKTSQTEEFSIEKINIELKQLVFPERKSRLEEIDKSRERELEEEIKRISEEIIRYKKQLGKFEKDEGNKLLQIRSASKKKSTSKIRLAIEEWEAFADLKLESINSTRVMKSGHLNNVDESHELKRNQITLFGEDSVREDVSDKHIKIKFPKEKCEILLNKPSKSMRQYLNQLSAKEVQIHSKFLQLDVGKKATKNEMLDCMEVLLKKIPEYYLWAFSKEEWRALEKLATFNEGEALPNIDTDSVTKAISVGLLDCKVLKRN
ncbi:MAG: plasmid pRiA4b ORF-3 family protein, partial [Clostridium sp.]|nr:plasmid pRiA4b ORF-3 family protein [Clostridium sp.]